MSGSTTSGNSTGYGSDTIALTLSEDQAEGKDAEFTVNVDGQQIGGVQTVSASHSAGQEQTFTFQGNYAPGQHNIAVTFGNNLIFPGNSGDRNLYVDGVTYDGQTVSNSTTAIYNAPLFPPTSTDGNHYGNAVYSVNDTTSVPAGSGPNPTSTPGPVSVGGGGDTLVLNMAEDAYQGDAQFTVAVDGQQIGGTQTTTAILNQGQSQEFDVHGNFGSGGHTVSVTFLNDQIGGFYPGTNWAIDTTDRNLYVMGTSLNGGAPAGGAPLELSNNGTANFYVTSGGNSSASAASSGFASDGAASDGSNAAITASSLGSSSGMSFVASPTSTATPAATTTGTSSSTTDTGTTSSGTTTASTDTTPSVAAAVSSTAQTSQDFIVPSTTSAAASVPTASSSGSNWWTAHQGTGGSGWAAYHQPG